MDAARRCGTALLIGSGETAKKAWYTLPMLIFAGVSTETTTSGTRHMLIFHSPMLPGVHYKVEADSATAARLRETIGVEVSAVSSTLPGHDECDGECDPRDRF